MGRKDHKALIIFFCCWLASCVKDKPTPRVSNVSSGHRGVYVVCEGNFGSGDATLYLYDRVKDSAYGDIYKSVNGQPLGDVFQDMERIGDKFFLCINNSDKVVVLDTATRKVVAAISIPKPRYILAVSPSKAYVSTLYSNKVYIVDTRSYSVTGTIALPYQNTEGMCLYGHTAVVCPWDTACANVYNINTLTDKVERPVKIAGYAPQAALVDKHGALWILAGNQTKGRAATWTRLDTLTGEVLRSYTFSPDADALKPVLNNAGDSLYYIEVNYKGGTANNGVYRMGVGDPSLPSAPFVQSRSYQYFWALGIDPASGDIYIGDPKGFIQKGSVSVYHAGGARVDSFTVGLGPGHFYFQ